MHHAPSALLLLLTITLLLAAPFAIEHLCQHFERKHAHRRAIRQRLADVRRDSFDIRRS